MKLFFYCGFILSFRLALGAQELRPDTAITRSVSGQFVIMKGARKAGTRPRNAQTNADIVQLEASVVSISCERIRQALRRELTDQSPARGKVYIWLIPAVSLEDDVDITSELFADGWHYHINLPDMLGRDKFVRAIVQVCLQEM